MDMSQVKSKINWYRSPVDRDVLAELNRRSDWKGAVQTFGHLGLLTLTGAAAFYARGQSAHLGLTLDSFCTWNYVRISAQRVSRTLS